jgi:hypothetical protein
LDWLSCSERWQSLRLLIMTYKKLYALPYVALSTWEVINDKKNRGHTFFSRIGLVVLLWTMTKSSSAYMTFKKLYALLC